MAEHHQDPFKEEKEALNLTELELTDLCYRGADLSTTTPSLYEEMIGDRACAGLFSSFCENHNMQPLSDFPVSYCERIGEIRDELAYSVLYRFSEAMKNSQPSAFLARHPDTIGRDVYANQDGACFFEDFRYRNLFGSGAGDLSALINANSGLFQNPIGECLTIVHLAFVKGEPCIELRPLFGRNVFGRENIQLYPVKWKSKIVSIEILALQMKSYIK